MSLDDLIKRLTVLKKNYSGKVDVKPSILGVQLIGKEKNQILFVMDMKNGIVNSWPSPKQVEVKK